MFSTSVIPLISNFISLVLTLNITRETGCGQHYRWQIEEPGTASFRSQTLKLQCQAHSQEHQEGGQSSRRLAALGFIGPLTSVDLHASSGQPRDVSIESWGGKTRLAIKGLILKSESDKARRGNTDHFSFLKEFQRCSIHHFFQLWRLLSRLRDRMGILLSPSKGSENIFSMHCEKRTPSGSFTLVTHPD